MIWVWVQSLVVLTLVFSGGLWFGGALVAWTSPRPAPRVVERHQDDIVMPAYHGADIVLAEPEPEPERVPEPLPVVAEPAWVPPPPPPPMPIPAPVRSRELLFPVNQFGTISVTRARIG